MEITHSNILKQTCGVDVGGGGAETYVLSLTCVLTLVKLLVEGCTARVHNPGSLRKHFMYRHRKYKIAILQEGPYLILQCTNCIMHMPKDRLERYKHTTSYNRVTEMELQRRNDDLVQISGKMEFSLYGREGDSMV